MSSVVLTNFGMIKTHLQVMDTQTSVFEGVRIIKRTHKVLFHTQTGVVMGQKLLRDTMSRKL